MRARESLNTTTNRFIFRLKNSIKDLKYVLNSAFGISDYKIKTDPQQVNIWLEWVDSNGKAAVRFNQNLLVPKPGFNYSAVFTLKVFSAVDRSYVKGIYISQSKSIQT